MAPSRRIGAVVLSLVVAGRYQLQHAVLPAREPRSERAAIAESSARRADRRRLQLGGGVGAIGRAAVARRA
eukprot:scaffold34860_cov52-Phaeocystis_antarctica.AAC.3